MPICSDFEPISTYSTGQLSRVRASPHGVQEMASVFTYLYKGKRSLLSHRNTINFTGRFLERQRASTSIPLQVTPH